MCGECQCIFASNSIFLSLLSLLGTPYDPYKALWFERKKDPVTKELTHIYRGGYWECKEKQDWSTCPDIFWSNSNKKEEDPQEKRTEDVWKAGSCGSLTECFPQICLS